MRFPGLKQTVTLSALLAVSSVVLAQNRQIPKMPNPPGPAPKHDLNGAWYGPLMAVAGEVPPLTPAGQARMKMNKPEREYTLAASNDPFQYCNPLGFPRNVLNHPVINGGQWFAQQPNNRIAIMYQYQRVWRDIWMDGRQLPAKVDAKGAPDSRFYGYSVGHWDGDNTLVIDTDGVDDRTWLDDTGHPHSTDMHVTERYTRLDQYNMELAITIDDPKYYTKPFDFLKAKYYWMVKQDFAETFCLPSDAVDYLNSLAKPAGAGDPAN
jgi:hypothetical protein